MTEIEEQLKQFDNMKNAEYIKAYFNLGVEMGKKEARKEILDIVENWKDVSIKIKDSNLALMITNGGYIHKWTLIEKLKQSLNSPLAQLVHEGSTPSQGDAPRGKGEA